MEKVEEEKANEIVEGTDGKENPDDDDASKMDENVFKQSTDIIETT